MRIALPDLTAPLDAIAACGSVQLDQHPDLSELFPEIDATYEAKAEEGEDPRFVRLLLGRSPAGRGHFHLDAVRQHVFGTQPRAGGSLDEIQDKCEWIAGKTIKFVFQSRFKVLATSIPKNSMINLLAGVEMNFEGAGASLTAATVRVTDPLRTEVRWRTARRDSARLFVIEIICSSDMLVSENVLTATERHVVDGFSRFVIGKRISEERASS